MRDFIVASTPRIFDARPELKKVVATAGDAFLEVDFVGTHTGKFAGIESTGAKLRVPYSVAYDLDDNRISAARRPPPGWARLPPAAAPERPRRRRRLETRAQRLRRRGVRR